LIAWPWFWPRRLRSYTHADARQRDMATNPPGLRPLIIVQPIETRNATLMPERKIRCVQVAPGATRRILIIRLLQQATIYCGYRRRACRTKEELAKYRAGPLPCSPTRECGRGSVRAIFSVGAFRAARASKRFVRILQVPLKTERARSWSRFRAWRGAQARQWGFCKRHNVDL
jgi:hypothetical protein